MTEKALLAKHEEPPTLISDVDVYMTTRKRDEKRKYKLPTEVVDNKIVNFVLVVISNYLVHYIDIFTCVSPVLIAR